MIKRVLLLSVDGLGVGETPDVRYTRKTDIGANTIKSIMETGVVLDTLDKLNLLSLDCKSRALSYKDYNILSGKCLLEYTGADSFLGHSEMLGRKTEVFASFLDDYAIKLRTELNRIYDNVRINNGFLSIDDKIFISNNMECDAGYAINVIIDNENKNYEQDIMIVDYIKAIIPVSRVLLIYGDNIFLGKIQQCVIEYSNSYKYSGVAIPLLNIYNDNYYVAHIANIQSEDTDLLEKLHKNGVAICLIGKTSYMFSNKEYDLYNSSDTKTIFKKIYDKWKEYEYTLIFANIQDVDLGGHECDPRKGADCLTIVDDFLKNFIDQLEDNDLLVLTADHGNDPIIGGRNHTREYVPVIAISKSIKGERIPVQRSLKYISKIIGDFFDG